MAISHGICRSIVLLIFIVEIITTDAKRTKHLISKRFTREDACKATGQTLQPVNGCPLNETALQKRSKEMKCENIHDSCSMELVYHCIPLNNKIVEVCAPRNMITGKCCAQFNEGLGRVLEDYSVSCPECPFHYYSNQSMIYRTCVESLQSLIVVQTTATLLEKSTSEHGPNSTSTYRRSTSTVKPKCMLSSGRNKRHSNCEQDNDINTKIPTGYKQPADKFSTDGNSETSFVDSGRPVFIAVLVVSLVALVIAFLNLKRPAGKICIASKENNVKHNVEALMEHV